MDIQYNVNMNVMVFCANGLRSLSRRERGQTSTPIGV